ncbi:MAG: glutathione peroxidase [Bdellovibrionaceae bacterium]|nr:glutathione peroxidase [Pseudobdellovibrionaceae bacterium]
MSFKNPEGTQVPQVTFKARKDGDWVEFTSDSLFKGKKVILFALPGAFTPTCSSSHLPRYNELAPIFKKNGIDEILCLSVNDGFVMEAWGKDQEADQITLLPDGNGEFSEKLGFLVNKSELGFGPRSWRYSMVINDGVVEKAFIEPEKPGDPFEVSDADTMLNYIAPEEKLPPVVTLFTKVGCPHCDRAKTHLESKGWKYEEIKLNRFLSSRSLKNITGQSTTPQIYIDGSHIGTADDLEKFLKG